MAGLIAKKLLMEVQRRHASSLVAGGTVRHPFGKLKNFSTIGEDSDSHSDFKPINKAPNEVPSAREVVEKDVKENSVMIYMKGVPDAPRCGFSALAVSVLKQHGSTSIMEPDMKCSINQAILEQSGIPFSARNILEDSDLKQSVKSFSNWPTFPQIFINGDFVGGSDILLELHKSGELKKMLDTNTVELEK
eukprot:TRINITY_DN404_c0_g1_i3.p1 TRINITY_DN404_c0_g1~~TRINITY_DN404_c0_g1_i3.p1  ORF type:complete len:191 (+),score=45.14 TRINITY_DN404_c0_g1_i3:153-725(+)